MISEVTEITDNKETAYPARGWILYDGHCRHCTTAARLSQPLFRRRGFLFIPLQTPWVQHQLGLAPNAALEEMRVLTADGLDFGGADAVLFLARQIWWARPLTLAARLPGARRLLDRSYRWIAVHRGCTHITGRNSSCTLSAKTGDRHRTGARFVVAAIPPLLALFIRPLVAPWAFMWAMAAAIFVSCKWITFWRAKPQLGIMSRARVAAYFFLWAGLDAPRFLGPRRTRPKTSEMVRILSQALLRTALGAVLLFAIARLVPQPLVAGWIGMVGLIFLLHFGLFDVGAAVWRAAGFNAAPIMNSPIAATSLSEFWGRRWNGAFNRLVIALSFRRFARRFGTIRATLAAFFLSGLLHELVISLPAGGGYGLPTGYFLLQGWAVVAQRLPAATELKLHRGFRGWFFTMFFTAAPAFWLFHPPFVQRVILPFMKSIGAL